MSDIKCSWLQFSVSWVIPSLARQESLRLITSAPAITVSLTHPFEKCLLMSDPFNVGQ